MRIRNHQRIRAGIGHLGVGYRQFTQSSAGHGCAVHLPLEGVPRRRIGQADAEAGGESRRNGLRHRRQQGQQVHITHHHGAHGVLDGITELVVPDIPCDGTIDQGGTHLVDIVGAILHGIGAYRICIQVADGIAVRINARLDDGRERQRVALRSECDSIERGGHWRLVGRNQGQHRHLARDGPGIVAHHDREVGALRPTGWVVEFQGASGGPGQQRPIGPPLIGERRPSHRHHRKHCLGAGTITGVAHRQADRLVGDYRQTRRQSLAHTADFDAERRHRGGAVCSHKVQRVQAGQEILVGDGKGSGIKAATRRQGNPGAHAVEADVGNRAVHPQDTVE